MARNHSLLDRRARWGHHTRVPRSIKTASSCAARHAEILSGAGAKYGWLFWYCSAHPANFRVRRVGLNVTWKAEGDHKTAVSRKMPQDMVLLEHRCFWSVTDLAAVRKNSPSVACESSHAAHALPQNSPPNWSTWRAFFVPSSQPAEKRQVSNRNEYHLIAVDIPSP
jgi:hypothetical protein